MTTRSFKPSRRYLVKVCVGIAVAGLLAIGGTIAFALLIPDREATTVFLLIALGEMVVWILALLLAGPYYGSLSYEVQDDEVIVRVGIITHSVKHVPYRTVTNITVSRDILDRWFFGLGSLHIQTAGMSGKSGAEEKLVGLPNVQEVYEMVVTELRRFRGGMAPTAAEVERGPLPASGETLTAILEELRAIRGALEK
ncbi:MAG TPA: PH domain-containing protein [Anaerolineae bacterium]|nr:PH domain-containing protein [Anaerolineae bacterium]